MERTCSEGTDAIVTKDEERLLPNVHVHEHLQYTHEYGVMPQRNTMEMVKDIKLHRVGHGQGRKGACGSTTNWSEREAIPY